MFTLAAAAIGATVLRAGVPAAEHGDEAVGRLATEGEY